MKTSKIKSISSKQSPKNLKRYSLLELEDGTKGTISHDKEGQYQVGQELKYNTKPTQDDPTKFWISEVKENNRGGSKRNYKADFAMKALECASRKDMTIPKEVIETAEKYFDRLQKKSLSANQDG